MFFLSCVLVLNPLGERLLGSQQNSLNEVNVKRERLTQIVLVIVGLLNLALIYFLYMDLRHSSWLLERKNEVGSLVERLPWRSNGYSNRGSLDSHSPQELY